MDASGIVLLGVKPNTILSVCRNISKSCGSLTKKSFISIAAGVRLEDLEMAIPSAKGFVRTMPNINSLVGEAATSLALGTKLQEGGIGRRRIRRRGVVRHPAPPNARLVLLHPLVVLIAWRRIRSRRRRQTDHGIAGTIIVDHWSAGDKGEWKSSRNIR